MLLFPFSCGGAGALLGDEGWAGGQVSPLLSHALGSVCCELLLAVALGPGEQHWSLLMYVGRSLLVALTLV